jgi:hypothetical protein
VSEPPLFAGIAAGQRWAKTWRNSARGARFRRSLSKRKRRAVEDFHRFTIYSSFLTDQFVVRSPDDDPEPQYCVPFITEQRLAHAYWARLKGWPRRGVSRQIEFIEGFVRGAAEIAKEARP